MATQGWAPPANDDATTPEQITHLVESVNCHPRALVLLAREVSALQQEQQQQNQQGGVTQTTANIEQLMAKLHRQNPNDRENSLYASVELSLRRLPAEVRDLLIPLQVLHGGGHLGILAHIMALEAEQAGAMVGALVEVGLAQVMAHHYIRLDPALSHYLALGQTAEQRAPYQQRWLAAMAQLVDFLYQQRDKDGPMAMQLCLLELPNLGALLQHLDQALTREPTLAAQVSDLTTSIEALLQPLGRKRLLAVAVALREQAAGLLAEHSETWSGGQFNNAKAAIEQLQHSGDLAGALTVAELLLQQAVAAGESAYESAAYDIAMAYALYGRVLRKNSPNRASA